MCSHRGFWCHVGSHGWLLIGRFLFFKFLNKCYKMNHLGLWNQYCAAHRRKCKAFVFHCADSSVSGLWWLSDIPLNLNAMDDYLDQASFQLEAHPRPPCLNFPSAEIINIGDHSCFFLLLILTLIFLIMLQRRKMKERMNIYIRSRLWCACIW